MNTLNKDQQIEDIEKTIAELSKQVEELKKPEEEEFKFCETGYISAEEGGEPCKVSGTHWEDESKIGRIFPTEALAVKYDKIITNSYKIAQAVAQLAPDYDTAYKGNLAKCHLVYCISDCKWVLDLHFNYKVAGAITFPESIKDQVVVLANSGALGLEV